jgi:hypothetical protein
LDLEVCRSQGLCLTQPDARSNQQLEQWTERTAQRRHVGGQSITFQVVDPNDRLVPTNLGTLLDPPALQSEGRQNTDRPEVVVDGELGVQNGNERARGPLGSSSDNDFEG